MNTVNCVNIPHRKKPVDFMNIIRIIVLTIISLLMIFPIFWLILCSFKGPSEVVNKNVFFPTKWVFQNYIEAFAAAPFGIYFFNSITTSLVTIATQVLFGAMAGYSFAKIKFKLNGFFFMLYMCCMMVASEATTVSNFLTISSLGLMDTFIAIVLPNLASIFATFLFRQFFKTVDDALLEAARIDGANDLSIFCRVMLPLSKSAIATVAIIGFIGSWNAYLWPLIITNSTHLRTVQTGLRSMMDDEKGVQYGALMAAAVMICLPVILLFIVMQKYFVQGITKVGLK